MVIELESSELRTILSLVSYELELLDKKSPATKGEKELWFAGHLTRLKEKLKLYSEVSIIQQYQKLS